MDVREIFWKLGFCILIYRIFDKCPSIMLKILLTSASSIQIASGVASVGIWSYPRRRECSHCQLITLWEPSICNRFSSCHTAYWVFSCTIYMYLSSIVSYFIEDTYNKVGQFRLIWCLLQYISKTCFITTAKILSILSPFSDHIKTLCLRLTFLSLIQISYE